MSNIDNELLTQYLKSYPEKSIAFLEKMSDAEIITLLNGLPKASTVLLLNSLKTTRAAGIFTSLNEQTFREAYSLLDPVRAAHFLIEAEKNKRDKKIQFLTEVEKKDLFELLQYPSNSAGHLMDMSLRTCRPSDTVGEATINLKKSKSVVREVFVTDIDGKLIGYLPVQDLLFSDDNVSIEKIMHKSPPFVSALSPKSEITEVFENFKTTVLPVIHNDGRLLGAIRYGSLVKEVQNKAISDMALMGGANPSEQALSPPLFSVAKRLPWLLINLATAFVASAVVGAFESTIAQVTALAVLLPVVAGQSGNTGAQAMAVVIRGLALREIRTRQWARLIFKELRVGFINGFVIALVTGIAVYFWSQNLGLSVVMTVAMTMSMIIASLSGAAIPVILTAFGKDPAQSSSVILTTVTDVMGFLSFLGLATLFISYLT